MYYTCPWRLGTIRSSLARGMRHRHMMILKSVTFTNETDSPPRAPPRTWIGVVWTRENPCARGWDPRERGFHVVGIHRPSHTVRDIRIRYVTIASYTVRAIRCVTIESNTVRAIRYVTIAYGT